MVNVSLSLVESNAMVRCLQFRKDYINRTGPFEVLDGHGDPVRPLLTEAQKQELKEIKEAEQRFGVQDDDFVPSSLREL